MESGSESSKRTKTFESTYLMTSDAQTFFSINLNIGDLKVEEEQEALRAPRRRTRKKKQTSDRVLRKMQKRLSTWHCNYKAFYIHSRVFADIDYEDFLRFPQPQRDASFLPQVLCSQKKEIPVVEARFMDEIYDTMVERLVPTAASGTNTSLTRIVGLAGPPGAGKTTIASEVAKRVNKLWPQKSRAFDSQGEPPQIAVVLPMDGFHLYRYQLDSMEDPKEAHARRGAPWTFDPNLFLKCLKTLREQGSVHAPSFDHGVGDPIEDDIFINVQHKVVIVEGNYLLLEEGKWKEISAILDEKWFVDVDIGIAMERVLKRHISTGNTPELVKQRIEYNDRPNAELDCKLKKSADLIIKSVSL